MYIPSVLFSFLEAALTRRLGVTEAEIKQLMSAHLTVHGGGRRIVEKMTV